MHGEHRNRSEISEAEGSQFIDDVIKTDNVLDQPVSVDDIQ